MVSTVHPTAGLSGRTHVADSIRHQDSKADRANDEEREDCATPQRQLSLEESVDDWMMADVRVGWIIMRDLSLCRISRVGLVAMKSTCRI